MWDLNLFRIKVEIAQMDSLTPWALRSRKKHTTDPEYRKQVEANKKELLVEVSLRLQEIFALQKKMIDSQEKLIDDQKKMKKRLDELTGNDRLKKILRQENKMRLAIAVFSILFLLGCGGSDGGEGSGGEVEEELLRPEFEVNSDCEDASMVEPFPETVWPVPDYWGVWDCTSEAPASLGLETGRFTFTLNSNGTFRQTIISGLTYPDDIRKQWNQCRLGTTPPTLAGDWVYSAAPDDPSILCLRYDVMPFRYTCQPAPRLNESGQLVFDYRRDPGRVEVYEDGTFVRSFSYPFTDVCVKQ